MRNQKGFTLIELLIVVVIIGILAAIAIPKFANTKEKAYVAAMKSDLRNMVSTQESYFADYTTYTTNWGVFQLSSGVNSAAIDADGTGFSAKVSHNGTSKTCTIGIGSKTPSGAKEGEPVCS
ncbi:MAG TPA: prepilin-type N-terminal cleavage/methylation domain-containing protein [Gemmatimonadales bacterium]|nr:prepilin-type N-terminal cleavage/methylation domain-containing protein [Gemmatimonadales bacterium]